ncbi:MAG TPA: D-glycero-beta-D-manno-heptose 1-phosphate adenylyltransferase [Bacteroidia bacterium]|nr:D-glycero-beta-D-manno-heptose 1-phosphate adenylyltransferase [Bacteroidia bacterium]HNT79849.1 D-glycero-beta-D-manno-heptose 1-phosphate adenylyltransferase [Bacteroidia bacterium]
MHYSEIIDRKIIKDDQLDSFIFRNRFLGKKIVFTNGCFDLIHLGHVSYLAEAAALGDLLILGVNGDESIKRLKGNSRPIQDENSRVRILASFAFVGAVCVFNEDTPYNLISRILPDILVKGSDYEPKDIVGYDIVTKNNGKVITIDYLHGYSTSNIEEKILSGKK